MYDPISVVAKKVVIGERSSFFVHHLLKLRRLVTVYKMNSSHLSLPKLYNGKDEIEPQSKEALKGELTQTCWAKIKDF
jgi:hypothetical protein